MYRQRRFILFTAAIFIAIVTPTTGHVRAAMTLIVPDNYSTIQAAINAASSGDTILVRAGTYFQRLNLNKSVILTAEFYDANDPTNNTTIIDGGASRSASTIDIAVGVSPMPTIRGFVIRNGNDGITAHSEAVIEYNYFLYSKDQLDYTAGGGGINRHNVYFASRDDAIDLDNMNRPLVIENNRMMYNMDDGIEVRLQDASAPAQPITIVIQNNKIIGSDEDGIQFIDYGQSVNTKRRYIIRNNLIANCRFAGIGLMGNQISIEDYSGANIIESIRVYRNTLYGNDYGISGGDNLVAFNNIVSHSITKGVWRVKGPAGANSVVAYTLFYNNGISADQSTLGAGNLFGQKPLFAYPPHAGPDSLWGTIDDDFNGLILRGGSPAVDAGVPQYTATNGELIPSTPITNFFGAAPDLGWKEFTPPIITTVYSAGARDGWVLESSEDSNQGGSLNEIAPAIRVGDNLQDRQFRSILSFDTASLPDNALITTVKLMVKAQAVVGISPFTTHGNLLVDLRKGAFGNDPTLQTSDFQAAANKPGAMIVGNTAVSGWHTGPLTAVNFAFVNLTGLTQVRLHFGNDDDDDLSADYVSFHSGDAVAQSRPKLIITYYLP